MQLALLLWNDHMNMRGAQLGQKVRLEADIVHKFAKQVQAKIRVGQTTAICSTQNVVAFPLRAVTVRVEGWVYKHDDVRLQQPRGCLGRALDSTA